MGTPGSFWSYYDSLTIKLWNQCRLAPPTSSCYCRRADGNVSFIKTLRHPLPPSQLDTWFYCTWQVQWNPWTKITHGLFQRGLIPERWPQSWNTIDLLVCRFLVVVQWVVLILGWSYFRDVLISWMVLRRGSTVLRAEHWIHAKVYT